ncbi:DUF2075 domain-containing protein [Longibaculum muris]|uniref:DUF2075 domain-containing protein n=1 Tax=Longibaculum muris TaxID=1796628 RepID=UPI0022E00D64|nr:DUF2075 domain-containing protein [Longibaculum muris]
MSNMIEEYDFDNLGIEEIKNISYGRNWPVVYILRGKKEAYVGETINAYQRMKQHKRNPKRRTLNKVNIIYDSEFNKSAILDIESLLINYMLSDQKYKLQNISSGINSQSNYYCRENYLNKFDDIWKSLLKQGLVKHDRLFLENLDIFKFSPYKALTDDQHIAAIDIIKALIDNKVQKKKSTFIVNGSPGTGKSVLAIYLMKLLVESQQAVNELNFIDDNINFITLLNLISQYYGQLKVGLVVPMESLRKTLKSVFKQIPGLKAKMVIGPSEVVKEHYDILIVDEAHRLRRRVNLQAGQYHTFDAINKGLKLYDETHQNDGDELDWILKSSDYQILFYDSHQSIKPSDIRKEKFEEIIEKVGTTQFTLTSQMRVKGGEYYITSIYKLLGQEIKKQIEVENYELKIFDDVNDMFELIKSKDKEEGLCRMVAGYAWPWRTKDVSYHDIDKEKLFDINIDGHHYIWNHTNKDWVNSLNAINEIGCIHTVQGYDLNYVGVIIGNEIKYDNVNQKIYIDSDNYFDKNGKKSLKTQQELYDYIINIYKVLLTRGIKGTYIYICNPELKEYFKQYIK